MKVFKTAIFIIIILSFAACAATTKLSKEEISKQDIIIFVPGYKGSRLVEEDSESTVWLSAAQLIFGGKPINLDSGYKLKPEGVLKTINVFPGIYKIDIYEKCINSLNKLGNYKIVEFAYDWRLSNTINASRFREFVLKLHKQGAKSVSVITHSMGGLPVAYALGYGEELNLDKVVFLSPVFRGTIIGFLDANRPLDPLPFNEKLYTRKDYVSFDSAYEFLPHPDDHSFTDVDQANSETIYNADNWLKYSWGVFHKRKYGPKAEKLKLEKLRKNLLISKSFFHSFDYIDATCPNSKILNIQGIGDSIVEKYSYTDAQAGKFKNEQSMVDADGDSLITKHSSSLPKSLLNCPNTQVEVSKSGHNRICNDKRVYKILEEYFKK